MSYTTLKFQREGSIGLLTVQRPEALNALNAKVLEDFEQFLKEISQENDLRCLIITGAGEKAFVAGADIKEMQSLPAAEAEKFAKRGQAIFQKIEMLDMPVIAAVNGFALGGGLELALACDFIVASKTAKLGLPEVSLGLIPGYGGTQRLSRQCGKAIARLMTLTGDMFTAEQCAQWGLVAFVVEPQDLMPTAMKLAGSVSKRSPRAVALAKKSIYSGFDTNQLQGLSIEAQAFHEAFGSQDKVEGVNAFVEKRQPQFSGR